MVGESELVKILREYIGRKDGESRDPKFNRAIRAKQPDRLKDTTEQVGRELGELSQRIKRLADALLKNGHGNGVASASRSDAAKRAWVTIRQRYTPQEISKRSRKAAHKAWKTIRSRKVVR